MWDFHHPEDAGCDLPAEFQVEYTIPSLCAEALKNGAADIGIIPAITYQRIRDLVIIPNVAIAAKSAVRSILLVSKVDFADIKNVAVDTSSRTSVALLEILFREGWIRKSKLLPDFIPRQPDLKKMLAAADAALLIGDPALTVDRSRFHVLDLAEVWNRNTNLPFVFAFWAVRKPALAAYSDADRLSKIFQQSRDHGLENIDELARQWGPRLHISETAIRSYLSQSINYALDAENIQGLELFFQLAKEQSHPLHFCAEQHTAQVR
jgi:chorismate dehydratase